MDKKSTITVLQTDINEYEDEEEDMEILKLAEDYANLGNQGDSINNELIDNNDSKHA